MRPLKLQNIFLFFCLLYFPLNLTAQNWPKIYGDNFNAYVNDIFEEYDHGFLIGGSVLANPNTFRYAWVIKTDINGNEIWNKKYGDGIHQTYLNGIDKKDNKGFII